MSAVISTSEQPFRSSTIDSPKSFFEPLEKPFQVSVPYLRASQEH